MRKHSGSFGVQLAGTLSRIPAGGWLITENREKMETPGVYVMYPLRSRLP